MNRKVFLSFLGTGNYKPCRYKSSQYGESSVVEYVQEAIYSLACNDFEASDRVYIFLTKGAEEKHWLKFKNKFHPHCHSLEPIRDMPEGYSEEEIWAIFQKVLDTLQEKDEIILDITYGFRSLPMLAMVLLNYAKSLKNISVKAIFYGAFEALGAGSDIDQLIPDPNDRLAPLLDLKSFSILQSWTFGAESFIKTGNPKEITELAKQNITPILAVTKGSDETAKTIRSLITALEIGEREIATNRGKLISNSSNFLKAKAEVEKLLVSDKQMFAPFKAILGTISKKLGNFHHGNNWTASVDWCIAHGLDQQGITQLQEGIIGFICEIVGLNSSDLTSREIVAQSLNIYTKQIPEADWKQPSKSNKELVEKICNNEFVQLHKGNYDSLAALRNDINHGGYKTDAIKNPEIFTRRLKEVYENFIQFSSQLEQKSDSPHAPQSL